MLHTLVIFMDLLNDQMQTGQLCNQQNVQLRLLLSSLAPLRTFILSPCQRFKLSCLYFYRYVSFNYVFIQVLVEFYKDPSRFNFVIAYYSVVNIGHLSFYLFFPQISTLEESAILIGRFIAHGTNLEMLKYMYRLRSRLWRNYCLIAVGLQCSGLFAEKLINSAVCIYIYIPKYFRRYIWINN